MKTQKLLNSAKLAPCRIAFSRAAQLSRAWNRVVQRGIARFGERRQGGHVSGIYSEHFPANWQRGLRTLAHAVSVETDKGFALRPSRVRMSTLRNLKSAVRAKEGCGFYG